MSFAVHITTNSNRIVLYTGTTNNLPRRLVEHDLKRGKPEIFARKNYCYKQLYYYDVSQTWWEPLRQKNELKENQESGKKS